MNCFHRLPSSSPVGYAATFLHLVAPPPFSIWLRRRLSRLNSRCRSPHCLLRRLPRRQLRSRSHSLVVPPSFSLLPCSSPVKIQISAVGCAAAFLAVGLDPDLTRCLLRRRSIKISPLVALPSFSSPIQIRRRAGSSSQQHSGVCS